MELGAGKLKKAIAQAIEKEQATGNLNCMKNKGSWVLGIKTRLKEKKCSKLKNSQMRKFKNRSMQYQNRNVEV